MPPLPINQSQFLHVTIDVPAAAKAKFLKGMRQLIPLFTKPCAPTGPVESFGWPLVTSMSSAAGQTLSFVHLWKMPNPARPLISEVMEVCGADNTYGTLDQLVTREVQDLMHSNDAYSPPNWPAAIPKGFVHEVLDMRADVKALVAFENAMEPLALQMQEKFGWTLGIAMVSNTGQLRRFVHLWQVSNPTPAAIKTATTFLVAQPAYRQAFQARDAQVFTPVTYGRQAS